MPRRTGPSAIILALAFSLVLHLSAFGLARAIGEGRVLSVTESRSPDDQSEPEPPPPTPPEEEEFSPGIEEGAKAVVTWIGYEEYEEHLAQLAQTEQAAFTSALARGVPDALSETPSPTEQITQMTHETAPTMDAPPTSSPDEQPQPIETIAEIASTREEAQAASSPAVEDSAAAAPQPAPVPMLEPAPTESPAIAPIESGPIEPVEVEPAETEPSVEENPAEREIQPSLDPFRVPLPLAMIQPMRQPPPSAPQGEPTPDNAAPSEKDSAATSTRDVPEVEWNNGKPMAREGLEIRPFSLERHIQWDSLDVLFGQRLNRGRWEGRIVRNPIVSIRFDRHGRVGEVKIIRPSGFKPLDEQYLAAWMARWTAAGARLNELAPGQLTNPIQFRLMFIDEPRPAARSAESDEGS